MFLFLVNFQKKELKIEIKIESIQGEAKAEKIWKNLTVRSMLTLANSPVTNNKHF